MKRWILLPALIASGTALTVMSGCAVPARTAAPAAERRNPDQVGQISDRVAQRVVERKAERLERRRAGLPNAAQPVQGAGSPGAIDRPNPAGDAVNPSQTSTDPTYGYSRENPVKLGSEYSDRQVASSYVYLKQLRDKNRKPFKVVRVGSMGANPDMHIIDRYKLTDSEGSEFTIYLDMYHPENNPLDCKAPLGMFMAQ